MASSHPSSVTVSQVGSQFVKKYYEVVQHHPEFAHRFYTASSTMIRVDGDSTQTASAISDIKKLVESLNLSGIVIKTINSVKSLSQGVTVVVSGSVKSNCFTGWRRFVQTFFLAPKEKMGYLVINDIFHFVTKKDLSGIVYTKHVSEIFHIIRKNGESVQDFTSRFTKETMRIPGASDDLKISGFIQGVRDDQLVRQLQHHMPQTFENLIHQVKNFVTVERIIAFNKEADTGKSARSNKRKQDTFSLTQAHSHKTRMIQPKTDDSQAAPLVITATLPGHRVGLRVQCERNVHRLSLEIKKAT